MSNQSLITETWKRSDRKPRAEYALVLGGIWYSRVLGVTQWDRLGAFDVDAMRNALIDAGFVQVDTVAA